MGSAPAPVLPPDVSEVIRIAGLTDPVIRNLEITHCYSVLSLAVTARTGRCANWCTFATWASRQAGQTIRGEDLLDTLDRRLRLGSALVHPVQSLWRALLRKGLFHPKTRLGRAVREIHSPFDAFERASDAVARGNRKVFEEIGLEFARYLQTCSADCAPDSPEFQDFLRGLRPGDPPDGQDYLRQAFTCYQQQRFSNDAGERAQLALLANLEIGLHEQTRLQPEICAALDSGTTTAGNLGERTLAALLPASPRWRKVLRLPALTFLDRIGRSLFRFSSELTRRVITDCLMVLSLPGVVLALSRNLEIAFPAVLRSPDNAELVKLLGRFEPAPPAPDNCGAEDWSKLHQRMHFIIHLFRAFHERAELFDPPYTPEQVRLFQSGVIPDGNL